MRNIEENDLIKRRFGKHINTYNNKAIVQKHICQKMIQVLSPFVCAGLSRVLEVGCGTGLMTNELIYRYKPSIYYANDLVKEAEQEIHKIFERNQYSTWRFLKGDAERISLPANLDLIVSTSAIQWFYDTEAFFEKAFEALKPGGILAISSFGPQNYQEIKALINSGLIYPGIYELRSSLERHYKILHSEEFIQKMTFQSPIEVLHHIKLIGANGIAPVRWTKRRLAAFSYQYRDAFSDEARNVVLTYHPIMLIAKKQF